jgi:hypothetical protein
VRVPAAAGGWRRRTSRQRRRPDPAGGGARSEPEGGARPGCGRSPQAARGCARSWLTVKAAVANNVGGDVWWGCCNWRGSWSWRGSWRWQPPRAGSVPWWSNPGRRGTASRCAVGEVRWSTGVVRRRRARGAVQIRGEGRRGAAPRARGEAAARHSEGWRGAAWRARRRREGEREAGGDSRGGERPAVWAGSGLRSAHAAGCGEEATHELLLHYRSRD